MPFVEGLGFCAELLHVRHGLLGCVEVSHYQEYCLGLPGCEFYYPVVKVFQCLLLLLVLAYIHVEEVDLEEGRYYLGNCYLKCTKLLGDTIGHVSVGELLVDSYCYSSSLGVLSEDIDVVVARRALDGSPGLLEADQVRSSVPYGLEGFLFNGRDVPLQES